MAQPLHVLREFGIAIPVGFRRVVPAVWAALEDADSGLPDAVRPALAEAGFDVAGDSGAMMLLESREEFIASMKTLRRRGAPHERLTEGQQVVLRLIRDFRPQVLAVEKAFFARNRDPAILNVLVDDIQALELQRVLRVRAYVPSTVKKAVYGDGAATEAEVARAVVARYPDARRAFRVVSSAGLMLASAAPPVRSLAARRACPKR